MGELHQLRENLRLGGGHGLQGLAQQRIQLPAQQLRALTDHVPAAARGELLDLAKGVIDSLLAANPKAAIIMMGDLNDTPASKSVKHLIGNRENLVNLTPFATGEKGTYKYRGDWSAIDQFIVSLYGSREMYVFAPEFLLEWDDAYMGVKPRRTYQGPKYLGGVSDHLPIILKIYGHR